MSRNGEVFGVMFCFAMSPSPHFRPSHILSFTARAFPGLLSFALVNTIVLRIGVVALDIGFPYPL